MSKGLNFYRGGTFRFSKSIRVGGKKYRSATVSSRKGGWMNILIKGLGRDKNRWESWN